MKRKLRDHIEKPEDKIWKQWFDKLTPKDHENYMAKLGLTEEDKKELPEIEQELHALDANAGKNIVMEERQVLKAKKKK